MRVAVDRALRQSVLPRQEAQGVTLGAVLADLTKLRMTTNLAALRHSLVYHLFGFFPVPVPALISPVF